jgi:hypothetical protein
MNIFDYVKSKLNKTNTGILDAKLVQLVGKAQAKIISGSIDKLHDKLDKEKKDKDKKKPK